MAFIGNRHPKFRNDEFDTPEFRPFFHEMNKKDKEDLADYHSSQKIMLEYLDSNSNVKKNNKESKKRSMFHRPTGEVLFFLYAWRYFVRLSSKFEISDIITNFDEFYYTSFSKPRFEDDVWFKLTTGFDFMDLFYTVKEKLGKEKENQQVIISKITYAFGIYWNYEFSFSEDNFIEKEWEILGINPHHTRGLLSLRALLEYANILAQASGDPSKSAERRKTRNDLEETIKQIKEEKWDEFDDDKKNNIKNSIHKSLAYVFYSLFNIEGNGKGTSYEAIFKNKFLKIVQFPVFPYFLQMLFDTEDEGRTAHHRPKEHLVLPIWYSDFITDKKKEGNIVAYSLISMEPVWSFTNRFDCYGNKNIQDLNNYRIKTLFQVISKGLIEKGFYEKVVKKQMQIPSTKAAISQVMARNMSHNIGSHVLSKYKSVNDFLPKPNNCEQFFPLTDLDN